MSETVKMVFWDVQHGHATYIKSPNNRHIVIDLGIGSYDDNNSSFSPLLHLRNNYYVQQLDYVILTHPHLDHIDDILNLHLLNPKVLSRPRQISNKEVMQEERDVITIRNQDKLKFEAYCDFNDRYNRILDETDPDNVAKAENFGGLVLKTFAPTGCDHNNFNNHSIITTLEYCGVKVVIPGDNEKCSFDELIKSNDFIKSIQDADLLLAPHHGRDSGYHDDFINLVNPRLTIVSDGRFCETSANARYSQKSRGWTVLKNNGQTEFRRCLTTNSDGEIFVEFGASEDANFKSFLSVKTKI